MRRPLAFVVLLMLSGVTLAVTPPDQIHYQGVLRDSAGEPLDGAYNMWFRLWSAETGGNEILVDRRGALLHDADGRKLSFHPGEGSRFSAARAACGWIFEGALCSDLFTFIHKIAQDVISDFTKIRLPALLARTQINQMHTQT